MPGSRGAFRMKAVWQISDGSMLTRWAKDVDPTLGEDRTDFKRELQKMVKLRNRLRLQRINSG